MREPIGDIIEARANYSIAVVEVRYAGRPQLWEFYCLFDRMLKPDEVREWLKESKRLDVPMDVVGSS